MEKKEIAVAIPNEIIMNKIYYIRGHKVMLDADLAGLYGVETKRLKEQVKRNIERFPKHYMFELTEKENEVIKAQAATLKRGEHSKYLPYAFTEHGVLQLSNVLKSKRAIEVSIKIIDVFVQLREVLANHTELRLEVEKIKRKLDNQGKNMEIVFKYLDELLEKKESRQNIEKPRKKIGYKIPKKK
ncbi:MAG: ORF6N domain-containing protein [Bacteroidetes bacterium]|nr:ORF6N domain-containing protein [Bacteroidota bacterium]MCA6444916.1 ORF6N domain-containing protein [Bacteroidota bacterium]